MQIKDFIEGGSLMFLARFNAHTVLTAGSMNFIEREVQGLDPDIILPGVNFSRLEIYKYTEELLSKHETTRPIEDWRQDLSKELGLS